MVARRQGGCLRLSEFDYDLPGELIAQKPLANRDASRLLVVNRKTGTIEHRRFVDIQDYVNRGDLFVLNDTKVIPARLLGKRGTGGKIEVLLLKDLGDDCWECLVRPGHKIKTADKVYMGKGEEPCLYGEVLSYTGFGGRVIRWSYEGDWWDIVDRIGTMPLPPYIKTPLEEASRYQTVYARIPGSAAAPTAGLHFTKSLMSALQERGAVFESITLSVGLGTFRPVKEEVVEDHKMHQESFVVTKGVVSQVERLRKEKGALWAVGTTVVRALESAAISEGFIKPFQGETELFIYPGYQFSVVDRLITNFHLPKSTLLMMVSAFAGKSLIMEAYRQAVKERYRFFSFGDAMLIL